MKPHRDSDGIWRLGYVIEHGELLEDPQADQRPEWIAPLPDTELRDVGVIGCPCGFDAHSVFPMFGPDWHLAHLKAHLAAFPNVDQGTRDNLARFITDAKRLSRPKAVA